MAQVAILCLLWHTLYYSHPAQRQLKAGAIPCPAVRFLVCVIKSLLLTSSYFRKLWVKDSRLLQPKDCIRVEARGWQQWAGFLGHISQPANASRPHNVIGTADVETKQCEWLWAVFFRFLSYALLLRNVCDASSWLGVLSLAPGGLVNWKAWELGGDSFCSIYPWLQW